MSESANVQTVRRYIEAGNTGVLEDVLATVTPDVVHYFLPARFPPIRGAEHLAKYFFKFRKVSDTFWTLDRIIEQGDQVAAEWSLLWSPPGTDRRLLSRGFEWYVMR